MSDIPWEARYVSVVRHGGHQRFFERFMEAVDIESLVIVSPWITPMRDELPLSSIIDRINRNAIPTVVILRPPTKEPMNREAAELLSDCEHVLLYYNNDLHAKIYVCRCSPFGFALLSSANLSGKATRAHEIGLMIEGKGPGTEIIEELGLVGQQDIPNRAGTIRASPAEGR